ncbi:MAG: M14 family metallopeptidase [Bryobacterales bacterium]
MIAGLLAVWAAWGAEPVGTDAVAAWARAHPAPGPLPDPVARYHAIAPALGALAAAAAEKPGAVRVEALGPTVRGNPVWAFTVAEPGEPVHDKVLVFAGIHALEWISTEAALQLLADLIAVPPRGTAVTVIPVLNVDGRLRAERDAWRGNVYRRGNGATPPVDLNRDFAVNREAHGVWARILPGYHATSPAPLSQPESRAIAALAARERFDRAASLHAFGGYLYVPWAGRWGRAADYPELLALGRRMEAAQGAHAYRTRQLARWGFFFRAHGAEIDQLYGETGTLAYLVEITRSGFDPAHPLGSWRTYLRWYNPVRPERHVERTLAAMRALIAG